MTFPQSIQVGNILFDLAANRPAAATVIAGTFFCGVDTSSLYQCELDPAGVRYWLTIVGGAGGATWGKYVVWGGAAPGPTVLYPTGTAALAAAVADGCGPAKPCQVLFMDGPYTENLVLRPGISMSALTGAGSSDSTPSVTITGQHTVFDAAGDLALVGLGLLSTTGVPLTFAGASNINVDLSGCYVRTTNVTSRAVLVTNTGVSSSLRLNDCYVDRVAGAVNTIETSVALQAHLSTIIGAVNEQALQLGVNTNDAFSFCDITGTIQKEAGICILRRTRVACTLIPVCLGNATFVPVDVESPNGFSLAPGITVTARQVQREHSKTTSSTGAGPFVLTAAMADTTVFAPGVGVAATATLPDVTTLVDGVDFEFVMGTTAGAGSSLALSAFAGQTIDGFATLVTLLEGGRVTLRANRTTSDWTVIAQVAARVGTLGLFVATTGNDSNPGTSALPFLTVDAAIARATKLSWQNGAHVNIGLGTFTLGASVVTFPCAGSVGGEPLALIGTLTDSGLGTRTIAASTVGNLTTVTYGTVQDSVGGLVVNAYRDMWIRLTGAGAQVGKRFIVTGNTANTFTVAGLFVAVTTETFVVEQPGTIIRWPAQNSEIFSAAGVGLQNIRLDGQGAGSGIRIRGGGTVYHTGCQFRDWSSINLESSQLTSMLSSTFSTSFPSLGLLNIVGSSFVSSVAGASVAGLRGGGVDYQNCLVRVRTNLTNGFVLSQNTEHQSDAGIRTGGSGSLSLSSPWFNTVTAIVGDNAANAAAIVSDGGSVIIANARVDACTGAALTLNGADAKVQGLQGATNAGVPVRLFMRSDLRQSLANSVTGAVAGNDVTLGTTAASAWAAVNAGIVNDIATVPSQYCVAGP